MTVLACPACRRIASSRVNERPSCIRRLRVRSPHRGAVRIWFAVDAYSAVGWIGIPSPVPTSCSRKSRIRMDYLVADRGPHDERAAIHGCSLRGGRDRCHVARCASGLREHLVAGLHGGRDRSPGRSLRRAHEVRERSKVFSIVFGIDDRVVRRRIPTADGVLEREQRARHAHLIEVCVRRKRLEARMLTLPSEPAQPALSVGFQHRHDDGRSAHVRRLAVADCGKRRVRDGLEFELRMLLHRNLHRGLHRFSKLAQ